MNRFSLKYRIAAAILILQTALMGLLLWHTMSVSHEISRDQLALREQTFLAVVGDISRIALITGEYNELQQYISGLRQDQQIVHVFLSDHRGRIVVSTSPYEIGKDIFPLENKEYLFWRTLEISNISGKLGVLAMQFSHAELDKAYSKTLRQSIGIASIGIAVFAIIGVYLGSLLTRRLGTLTNTALSFAEGKLDTRVEMPGNDEVGVLSHAFNSMADNIKASITELKNSELALRESSVKFRAVFENSVDAIGASSGGINGLFNPAYLQLFGYERPEELIGKPTLDLIAPDQRPLISDRIQRRAQGEDVPTFYETRGLRKDGSEFDMEVHVSTYTLGDEVYTLVILRDISDRKRIEAEIARVRKLESVGVLAGGIAHDFNNLLTAIMGNISLALASAKPGDKIYERLIDAERASVRAKDLTQQLLTFSKGGAPIKRVLSIGALIKETSGFALRGSKVRCDYVIPDDIWPVEIDEGQISQVIHNLIINAVQAMQGGGAIEISVENIVLDNANSAQMREGKYVKMSIRDQGPGIPAEYLSRIFDPYFTTKEGGSGLGLAITYSIITKHNGYIQVDSKEGAGAAFHLYLPASENKILAEKRYDNEPITGKGRILLMDDDKMLREVAGEILKVLGYEVAFTKDGGEAIALYSEEKRKGKAFDLVIMDLTIPGGMGGKEAITKLIEADPAVKAVVSSGYSNDPVMADYKKYGFEGVVTKPYKIKELSETIFRVLNMRKG